MHTVNQDGLRVDDATVAGGGIPDMANRGVTVERGESFLVEGLGNLPHGAGQVQPVGIRGGDARTLLAAVLQGIQPEPGQRRSFRMTVDPENSAFVVEFVAVLHQLAARSK